MVKKTRIIISIIMLILGFIYGFNFIKLQNDNKIFKDDLSKLEQINEYNKSWLYDDLESYKNYIEYIKKSKIELDEWKISHFENSQKEIILKQKNDVKYILDTTKIGLDNIWDKKQINENEIRNYYEILFNSINEKIIFLKNKINIYDIINNVIQITFILFMFLFAIISFCLNKKKSPFT